MQAGGAPPRATLPRSGRLPARAALVGALAGAAAGVAVRAAWTEPRSLGFPELPIALGDWPAHLDGYRVALVSDLHTGMGHTNLRRLDEVVRSVVALRPDLVCLLGDYVDATPLGRGRVRAEDVARRLSGLPNAIAVLGNHDWKATGATMGHALERHGIPVLENDAREVARGLWVAGTADSRSRRPDVAAALAEVPGDARVLLMSHDPDVFPLVPARVALTVSGHLHGGQVALPGIARVFAPTRYGRRFLHGHVVEQGRHLYVSAGVGTTGLPFRLLAPPEVPILRLSAALPSAPSSG